MHIVIGILMIIAGIFALMNPLAATLTVEQLLGWLFLIGGIFQVFGVFREETWGQKIWAILLAAINIFIGINLLGKPLAGVLALTYLVAIMFAASGVVKVIMSFKLRGTGLFWAMLLSGVVSVVLAVMILSNFPQSAATLLGILLAIELISSGVSLMVLGFSAKEEAEAA
ncbi:MAG: DUF308 domain-containing protein [Pseudomonadota bacterium]